MNCIRYLVSGRVQGVWFRQSTVEQARSLGLRGFVRNLPDGRVEAIACGTDDALARLERWLWQGPPLAKVSNVSAAPAEEIGFADFTVR